MNTIKAKNRIEALKSLNYSPIYWKGNKPYCQIYGIYTRNVFAIRISKGEYMIISEKVN